METFGMEPVSEGLIIRDSLGLGPGLHVVLCEAAILNSPASFLATGAAPGDHERVLPSNLGHNVLGPLPKSIPPHCTGVQPWGIWNMVSVFWGTEEGTVAVCRRQTLSDTVCGQWGVRRQATGLGGRESLPEPLDDFYSCPMTATHKVWAAQATGSHVCQGPGTTSALHRPIPQLRSPAACCRAQGANCSSGSFALVGILALLHTTR